MAIMRNQIKCFIVFSSENHVDYINNVLNRIKELLIDNKIEPMTLVDKVRSTDTYFDELKDLIKKSHMGIVIADGLRPNVLFEYGFLEGLNKPVILLADQEAEVAVKSFYLNHSFSSSTMNLDDIDNPKLDLGKNFSDFAGKHCKYYSHSQRGRSPLTLKASLENELEKIIPKIILKLDVNLDNIFTNLSLINEGKIVKILTAISLLDGIGWFSNFPEDNEFERNPSILCETFNLGIEEEELKEIVKIFIEHDYVKKLGRFIFIPYENLNKELFERLLQENQLSTIINSVFSSENVEFKLRFMKKIINYPSSNELRDIISNVVSDQNRFRTLEEVEQGMNPSLFFYLGLISPNEILGKIIGIFEDKTDNFLINHYEREFQLNPYVGVFNYSGPIKARNYFLTLLKKTSCYRENFEDSMSILFRFSMIEKNNWYNKGIDILAKIFSPFHYSAATLDDKIRFIQQNIDLNNQEHCNLLISFIGYILSPDLSYSVTSISLGFPLPSPYLIRDTAGFNEREDYRRYAIDLMLRLLETEFDDIKIAIQDNCMKNLAVILNFYNFDKIREFWDSLIMDNSSNKFRILTIINDYAKYDIYKSSITEENYENFQIYRRNLYNSMTFYEKFEFYSTMDMLKSNFQIENRNQYDTWIKSQDIYFAQEIYNDDNKFRNVADILFTEFRIRIMNLGLEYAKLDPLREKWPIIKLVFIKIENRNSINFIGHYLHTLQYENLERWEEIFEDILNEPPLSSYKIDLLIRQDLNDFHVNKIKHLLDEGIIEINELIRMIVKTKFNGVNENNIIFILNLILNEPDILLDSILLQFHHRLIIQQEEISDELGNLILDFLLDLTRINFDAINLSEWAKVLNSLCDLNNSFFSTIFDKFSENLGAIPSLSLSNKSIEPFIIYYLKKEYDEAIFKIKEIFLNEEKKDDFIFKISIETFNSLKFSDLKDIININTNQNLIIIAEKFEDILPKSKSVPKLIESLLNEFDNENFEEKLSECFYGTRGRFFVGHIRDSYKNDINKLINWRENTNSVKVKSWIDSTIEKLNLYMERDGNSFDEIRFR
jgi:hypothetical protein